MFLFYSFSYKTKTSEIALQSSKLKLGWQKKADGLHLNSLLVNQDGKWVKMNTSRAEYTVLYSANPIDTAPVKLTNMDGAASEFGEIQFKGLYKRFEENLSPANMNIAGEAVHFYPDRVSSQADQLVFTKENSLFKLNAAWKIDAKQATDIMVTITMQAKVAGYYSIASPSLVVAKSQDLKWATVPGYFQGKEISKNFIQAYAYGQGIPDKPVVFRERTATTLAPIISLKNGLGIATIASPETGRAIWQGSKNTHNEWNLGLSIMNRKAELSPTLYHPVIGQNKSYLAVGDTIVFNFRYTVQSGDWYALYKHAVDSVYRFNDFLKLKKTNKSLTERVISMRDYLTEDKSSRWQIEDYEGSKIGAQAYLGGVYKSDKDALKNSDYGAMWMLSKIGSDSVLAKSRLPYALNFKLKQQQLSGYFRGAPKGQYYLWKSKTFTEEWGNYVEPIALTYYIMLDAGNILLFDPKNQELKNEIQLGGDRLLEWMKADGSFAVAYDHLGDNEVFRDLEDLRPTFYGLLVAYKILNDEKYLKGAKKAADWYVKNAVDEGKFLGVCGDTRFVPDFATGQSAQALLDLYEITKLERYLEAAIDVAKLYTTSIYTHPIPSTREVVVKGVKRQEWEISQVGLSFEHGGTLGSANKLGPILLASHAGLFVRIYQLTNDPLFINMARAASFGRDAFVNQGTSVASYYWNAMDQGAGPFPHHAWWQVGWITDYLLAEINFRSSGKVSFPKGFITPKVGPHQTYGFLPGSVYGHSAELILRKALIKTSLPQVDYFTAINTKEKKLFVFLLNNGSETCIPEIAVNDKQIILGKEVKLNALTMLQDQGDKTLVAKPSKFTIEIPAYGIQVLTIDYTL
ncbi:MAG: glycerophosphoryl diester phosphodiesterase [Pedobacter sp.]|nr:MAG: glycerophosphoryl diester phosphodiesterase [Pedobacter sp.]